MSTSSSTITLTGVSGANPVGFLVALGTLATAATRWPDTRLGWHLVEGVWRPALAGCGQDPQTFVDELDNVLAELPLDVFEASGRWPFGVEPYLELLRQQLEAAVQGNRRQLDLLAGLGSDLYPDAKGVFQDTRLRMVRSGDSKGHGLSAYVRAARRDAGPEHLRRTLFEAWDYRDAGSGLRLDPIEDQRHALLWDDPQKHDKKVIRTMLGATSLVAEAFRLLPIFVTEGVRTARTTGFRRSKAGETFSWPIWEPPLGLDPVRSIVALADLHEDPVPRGTLQPMGIAEVFRSQRVMQSKYYANFTVARPA